MGWRMVQLGDGKGCNGKVGGVNRRMACLRLWRDYTQTNFKVQVMTIGEITEVDTGKIICVEINITEYWVKLWERGR